MRYVISDIHGELKKLELLISLINNASAEFIFLGDYIDKGINSKGVVDFLIELKNSNKCIFLIGDHEYAWIRYFSGEERFLDFILKYGGIKTLESYTAKAPEEDPRKYFLRYKRDLSLIFAIHQDFYEGLKFYHQDPGFIYVHAGLNKKNKNTSLDKHDKEEIVFIRNEFIESDFYYMGKRIVFGHTAFKSPYIDDFKIGIDTGAVYKEDGFGYLTAFNIDAREFIKHDGTVHRMR